MRCSIAMLFGLMYAIACERAPQPQNAAPAGADSGPAVATSQAAYNGHHFRELLRRYPHSGLADDASYQLTNLMAEGQECEGWVPCYAHTQWRPMAEFLRAYPTSPLADSAVTRGLDLFGRVLDPKVYRDPYDYEQAEMLEILASFDTVTSRLPEPLRNKSDSALIQWHTWVEQSDD